MKKRSRIVMAAGLVAAAGLPVSAQEGAAAPASEAAAPVAAVEAPPAEAPPAEAPAVAAAPVPAPPQAQPAAQPAEPRPIRFNFKDAPFDQVLDFFSRESGLPPIREVPVPDGTMTFISGESYSFEEALTILNLNLQPRGVQVQREDNFLYLRSLKDSARKAAQVVSGEMPAGVRPEKIVNLTIPLNNVRADVVVEQIKPLVGEYGSVQAVPAQNMLIIVETAAQCRRIQQIVQAIDSVKPVDSAYKLFPLKHAQCDAVFNALKGLVGQRKTTVVIDKDNKQRTIEEVDIAGLNLQPDPRTNSIIAVGPAARISVVEELIALLDVPEGLSGDRKMMTFALDAVVPARAAEDLNRLFAPIEPAKRPTIIPLDAQGKVTVVAADALMAQAIALIGEIDPGSARAGRAPAPERRAAILRLTHITPAAVEGLAPRLLTPRQAAAVKFASTPDGRGLVITGPDADVAAMEQLITSLDVPGQGPKDVRRLPVGAGDGKSLLERSLAIYKTQTEGVAGAGPVEASLDETGTSILAIASPDALQRFAKIVEELGRHVGQQRDIRLIELRFAPAANVKSFMDDMIKSSASFRAKGDPDPVFEVIEANNSLMIAAQPSQFPIIEAMVRNLDLQQGAERPPLRILRLKATDAASVAAILQGSFDRRSSEQKAKKPVDITADAATNTLIVSAHPDTLPEIEKLVEELNLQQAYDAEGREIRIFPLKIARAEELARTIDQMYPEPPMPRDPRNGQPRPDLQRPKEVVVRADRGTNSLIVDAPAKRLAGFEQIVRSLDAQKLGANVELRTYHVERADLNAAAQAIRNAAASGALAAGGNGVTPVTVDIEPMSRTLVVSGPSDVFKGVEEVLKKVDSAPARPATGVKMYSLKSVRSERIQPLVQKVIAGRTRELQTANPGLDVASLVDVTAESSSNTLVVSAPESVLTICDALIQTLDSQGVAGATELRVFRLERGDAASTATAITRTLSAENPGEPAPTVTPEAASNSIVMVGTRVQIEKAQKLVEQLDAATQKDGVGARTIRLKHARAESIAPVLDTLLKKESVANLLPPWERGGFLARQGFKAEPEVRIAAERSINAVVVTAPVAVLDTAEQIIAELDVDPATISGRPERPVRIITLQNADASELAASVQAVIAEEKPGVQPAVVRVDRASNSLIIRASADQLSSIEAVVQKLDAATLSTSRQMRMIPVDRSKADAELMARTIQKLLEQQGGVKVEVVPVEQLLRKEEPKKTSDARGTSLLGGTPLPGVLDFLPTSDEAIARASEPASDRPAPPGSLIHTALAAAALAWQPEAPKPAAPDSGITIAVDPATNSLIVVGSPRATDRLAALAAQLEQQMPAEPSKVRIVGLPPLADTESLAQVIRQTVQQLGRVGPGNPGGFTGPVSVMPDPGATALIVWANDTDFESVGELIRAVSQLEPAASLTVKVYPLASVTADRAIRAVQDLLSPQPRGAQARRLRGSMDVTVKGPDGKDVKATIDPALVRLTSDPSGASIIVTAPATVLPLLDSFISLLDQSPVTDRLSIRRYDLANARAQDLAQTLQTMLDTQRQGHAEELPRARTVPDARTNSILVTATDRQHADVMRLIGALDQSMEDKDLKLEIITLQNATPSSVQRVIEQIVVGRNPALKERVQVSAQDGSNVLVIRAPAEQIGEIRDIVARVDTAEVGGLPIRFVKLERADAQTVAAALQRFFQERSQASGRAGQRGVNRVAVMGDRRSGSLVISASDEDFDQVKSLISTFDAPAKAKEMQMRIIPLQNARVTDLAETLENISWQLREDRLGGWSPWGGGRAPETGDDKLILQTNERINSIILMGQGETMETMLKVVAELDRPQSDQTRLIVKSIRVDRGDLNAMATMVRQVTATPGWRSWQGPDPDLVAAQVDQSRRLIMLVGKQARVDQAVQYINEMKGATGREGSTMETLTLRHAQAPRAAETLRRVFRDRAEAQGLPEDAVSIIGSPDGNLLMISADEAGMKVAKDLVALLDQPELGKDRQIEVYAVRNREADELANLVRAQFPRGGAGRQDAQVIVTAQPSTNSLIVSALADDQPQVQALIKQLDAAPSEETSRLTTVTLKSARAEDVANALRSALPSGIKVRITPVRRNNTLLLTGSDETIKVVMEQIARIDVEVERSPVEFKRVQLKHALSPDVAFTIEMMLRSRPRTPGEPEPSVDYTRSDNTLAFSGTPDQIRDIAKMVEALDVPSETKRRTEFVKLEFAKAEQTAKALEVFYGRFARAATTPAAQNVAIVPDPASNSLVISADESEWDGLRGLLKKLDTEEYDTSRQLAVLPLKHADATSVARALNEGFRAPTAERLRREQNQRQPNQGGRRQDELPEPTILVDSEPTPTVSAEPQTNSLVVFAGRKDLVRIKSMVDQIDIPDFIKYAEAHVLPLRTGKASQIAQSVRELFIGQRLTGAQAGGPRATVIVGDDTSNSLIIRAEERDFAQIKALAEVLQQQGAISQATVRVLPVRNIPAMRLVKTLETTFAQAAKQQNEVLSIEVDRTTNSLVIAASRRIYEQIEEVVRELDGGVAIKPDQVQGPHGPLGQSVTIIDVVNNAPEDIRRQLDAMGLTRQQPGDRPGVVSEPVTITALNSRRAIAVVAGPQDGEAVRALVKVLDADPLSPEQKVAMVGLKMATASGVVQTLTEMLKPEAQVSQTGPARVLAEQIRRLSIANNTIGKNDHILDLAKPIRLIADAETNSVIISSTEANVASLLEVIKTLDTLPIGDAVVVRIFPLSNASATRAKAVVDDLFRQGEALRRLPGTRRQGLPTTATGRALAGEIAVSVDDRTNTLVVAGREEAVALVEIVIKDLDSDQASKWIEPALIPLKNADAVALAATLRQVLVQGLTLTPEALGLQKQVGRLRMARAGRDMSNPANRVEADLFAPLSGLVITPEGQLNALIVVGSTANIDVVRELVSLLDVEAASAANTVRIFPLQRAAADRVAGLVGNLFRQRQEDPSAKDEDRVIIASDARTNSLIVSTSPRSFSILEAMLKTLDTEQANATVGLHVVPVTGANVQNLAPKIDKLMRERIAASQRSGEVRSPLDTFSIESDTASNLLIVACSEENLQLVKELVKTLSDGSLAIAGAARTDVLQLKSGRAVDVAATIRQLYVDKENAKRGTDSVGVLPNERLNALVVTGTDSDIDQMRSLVTRLEGAGIATAQDIRRIGLRSANALEVVQLIQNVLAGRTVAGGADIAARQATNIRFFREKVAQVVEGQVGAKPTEAQVDGAIREQVALTPDLRTNSVMVKAPPEVMEVIKAIIEDLDTTSAGARRIERFTLRNADVRQMADLLRDIFTLRQQGNKYVLVPTMGPAPGEPGSTPDTGTMTPVPDERQELSIAIDARTNTLIVSGTEEYLDRVRQLVTDLDAIEAQERTQQIYAVRNAKAKEIEATLQTYFRGESGLARSLLGPDQSGSAMRQLEQEVTVVGDEKSNRLLVSTSPRYIDAVMKMIAELDTAPPQVVIQVLLAEVTVDAANTWGADLRLKGIGSNNFNFVGLAAGAGVATALGVPNLTFATNDFDLILRALEAQGKLQVLSSPHIVARNNQIATINVGDNIAIVQSVERTPQGGTVADVRREDLGIKLNVTPSISPDGFVRMDLVPEIQTLSQRTTQISEDFAAPIINKRTLQTTVTVKDGQTVVLGGLMQTTQDERRTKVPILGDFPVVGSLFRSTQKSDAKTELLMIVTPRVIYNDTPGAVERFRNLSEQKIDALDSQGAVRDTLKRNGFTDEDNGPPLRPEIYRPENRP